MGGDIYTVAVADPDEAAAGGYRGYCNKQAHKIAYCDDGSTTESKNTVLHEVLHAVFSDAGLKGNEGEEKIVTLLANRLRDVFTINPKLRDYLFA